MVGFYADTFLNCVLNVITRTFKFLFLFYNDIVLNIGKAKHIILLNIYSAY